MNKIKLLAIYFSDVKMKYNMAGRTTNSNPRLFYFMGYII